MASATDTARGVETLSSRPGLARNLLRGALTARGRSGEVPARAVRLEAYSVDRANLLAYQRLCGFAVNDALPHTYPHVVGFPLQVALMARRDFPMPLPGLVHLENTITVHRATDADDVLDITVHAEDRRPHRSGTLVDLVTSVEVAGERVWDGRSTYLQRGRPLGAPVDRSQPPGVPPGDPVALWQLPEGLGRAYGAVSGDVNPIHLHALTARAMGFPRAIAHGMWTSARTLAALGSASSGPSTSHVWFRRPVLLPGTVALTVAHQEGRDVAALTSPMDRGKDHLVLTLSR